MDKPAFEVGLVGLGAMGANFAWNIASRGFAVLGLDRDPDRAAAFRSATGEQGDLRAAAAAVNDGAALVAGLRRPRAIILLVPAGKPVDSVIRQLRPRMEPGDILIDAGNSHFTDTQARAQRLGRHGIRFLGVGISGGEAGARHGPSIMPGGPSTAWERVRPVFEAAAARVDNDPCVTWLGANPAGHYVKMVHNGIEYGLMQLIAEAYDLLHRGLGLDPDAMHTVFRGWSDSELGGYLIDITADILVRHDDRRGGYLLDHVLDTARQKGTGMWTSQEAMELQVPTPLINAAVAMRALSDYKDERQEASALLGGPHQGGDSAAAREALIAKLGRALHAGMLMAYSQGMHLLAVGNREHGFGTSMEDVARIWRGGCIIRARLLEDLRRAYGRDGSLENPLLDPDIAAMVQARQDDMRTVVETAARWGLPMPGLMAGLGYYDSLRSARLPANLIQAQRDYFGAHRFQRTDRDGSFHVRWA